MTYDKIHEITGVSSSTIRKGLCLAKCVREFRMYHALHDHFLINKHIDILAEDDPWATLQQIVTHANFRICKGTINWILYDVNYYLIIPCSKSIITDHQ